MTGAVPDPQAEAEALAFYRTVRDYEHHFNTIEFEVRKLASAWLIAAFTAIGFIVRGDITGNSLFSSWTMLLLVAGLAQLGLFTLWILDQVVYHGLLDAVFTKALHIERQLPQLPPLRSMMMRISGGAGMARYLSLFYLLPMLLFAILAWFAAIRVVEAGAPVQPWIGIATIISGLPIWVIVKSAMLDRGRRRNRPPAEASGEPAHEFVIKRWQATLAAATELDPQSAA